MPLRFNPPHPPDPECPEKRLVKVGKEMRLGERVISWKNHYKHEVMRFGIFPPSDGSNQIVVVDETGDLQVPAYGRLEKLVQFELEDLVQHGVCLDPNFRNLKKPPPPCPKRGKAPCLEEDCTFVYHPF
jgi:hypothetical protein